LVGEGDLLGVALEEGDGERLAGDLGLRPAGLGALACDGEHRFTEVEPGHFKPLARECERHIPRAATKVKGAGAGLGCCELEQTAFPEAMHAETLEVVDQVVTPRNGREEGVHLGGAVIARGIVLVGHGARRLPRTALNGHAGMRTARQGILMASKDRKTLDTGRKTCRLLGNGDGHCTKSCKGLRESCPESIQAVDTFGNGGKTKHT
jgi:hypothetical protein